mmetsp:Transcript_22042/g.68937  ORF Transcript_22042/g.68937 Transcript_22042/m.68937 type:complete len:235 (-) Transcript_22042:1553-2257(-)
MSYADICHASSCAVGLHSHARRARCALVYGVNRYGARVICLYQTLRCMYLHTDRKQGVFAFMMCFIFQGEFRHSRRGSPDHINLSILKPQNHCCILIAAAHCTSHSHGGHRTPVVIWPILLKRLSRYMRNILVVNQNKVFRPLNDPLEDREIKFEGISRQVLVTRTLVADAKFDFKQGTAAAHHNQLCVMPDTDVLHWVCKTHETNRFIWDQLSASAHTMTFCQEDQAITSAAD